MLFWGVRKVVELSLVLAAVALSSAYFLSDSVGPTLPRAGIYRPDGPPLEFNGVRAGEKLVDLESRLGPPDFKNPQALYQQWEHPLTQIHYDRSGVVVEVGGSGRGVLRQGDQVLLRCGDKEQAITKVFGPSQPSGALYRYPGVEIFCGSEGPEGRWISNIQLTLASL
jgi:hypothetical protein